VFHVKPISDLRGLARSSDPTSHTVKAGRADIADIGVGIARRTAPNSPDTAAPAAVRASLVAVNFDCTQTVDELALLAGLKPVRPHRRLGTSSRLRTREIGYLLRRSPCAVSNRVGNASHRRLPP
jgi:hypothetical protein